MRLPRPRFTVRSMTALVALTALAAGGLKLRSRSRALQDEADYHALLARSPLVEVRPAPADMEKFRVEWAKYQTQLKIKYERAAQHPWLLVEPDPPVPK